MSRITNSTVLHQSGLGACSACFCEVERLWRDRLEQVRDLVRQRSPVVVAEALAALESLPLATADFAVAKARLENLHDYAWRGEWGAAEFELRLLKILA